MKKNIKLNLYDIKITFENKNKVHTFLEEEKKIFNYLWSLPNKKTLIKEEGNVFGGSIKTNIEENYNYLIRNIHELNFNIEEEISKYYKEKKLIYSKSSFFKELQKERNLQKYKLAIYMLGIFTNSLPIKHINLEILELAKIKVKEYKKNHTEIEPYKVLIIDGGGILGYYEAALLLSLDEYFKKSKSNTEQSIDMRKSFNMICGTSTGAILAAGIAQGDIKLSEIKNLYRNNAKSIFPNPTPEGLSLFPWFLKHFFKPSASQEVLKKLLNQTFKETTLSDIWEKKNIALCIPSVVVDNRRTHIFRTPHNKDKQMDKDLKLREVCLASSAAPIFFPLAKLEKQTPDKDKSYTDGGLWANNPILIGLGEALIMAEENQPIEIYSLAPPINNQADINFTQAKYQGIYHWKFGVNIVDISLFVQSEGYNIIADSLTESLSSLGKKIKIIKFPQDNRTGKNFLKDLGLDKNSENSFKIMDSIIDNIVNDNTLSKVQNITEIKKIFIK